MLRSDRVIYARQLSAHDPTISKRRLQAALVAHFGVGLSDQTRRAIIRDTGQERPPVPPRRERIAYAQSVVAQSPLIKLRDLRSSIRTKYGAGLSDITLRQAIRTANTIRAVAARVVSPVFSPYERRVLLEWLQHKAPPYVIGVINERYTLAIEAKKQGTTYRQFFRRIYEEAKERGWIITHLTDQRASEGCKVGDIDIYRVIRNYRDRSIERGDYIPPARPPHRTSRDTIRLQKGKWAMMQDARLTSKNIERERQKTRAAIAIKESQQSRSSGERKVQLHNEIQRLAEYLKGLK